MELQDIKVVLVVGSGGREHAFARKISTDDPSLTVLMAPGNAGWPLKLRRRVRADDIKSIVNLCTSEKIDFVVVGPEVPLALGLVDALKAVGVLVFGPTQEAAQLESSKFFMKQACSATKVRTAEYDVATTMIEAYDIITGRGFTVVKADGLCGGKGVMPADITGVAFDFAIKLLSKKICPGAGDRVIIERKLKGREASVQFLCDGVNAIALPVAKDYKRRFEGDKGSNTGGMGAVCPIEEGEALSEETRTSVVIPILEYMMACGTPFQGILYVGLMTVEEDGKPVQYVLEFNARGGDPEMQVILPLISSELLPYLFAATEVGGLASMPPLLLSGETAVAIAAVMVGYPDSYLTDVPLSDMGKDSPTSFLYHAGTEEKESGNMVTVGGRVVYGVGLGLNKHVALGQAEARLKKVLFDGKRLREDIGKD